MQTKTVEVNGVRISCNVAGTGAPVLYIHGNTGSKLWYERVMEVEGAHTVAPDLPNFGDSDHIEVADIDVYADYLRDFVRRAELPTPLPVVGHSLGGAVAISLSLRTPELVSHLMLVDSAPLDGLKTPEDRYPIIERYKSDRELLKKGLQAVTPTLDDPAFLEHLTDEAMKMNPIAFTGNARALERFDYRGSAGEFDRPVLVVVGEKDVIITREMAEATAAGFPRAELRVLEGVGHSVMVETPELFIRLLREFLDEQGA
jgi:branched-chain amino acid transport system permease protein